MRFLAVACLMLCAPSLAQELSINGYSQVVIPPADGQMFDASGALRAATREVGFEVHARVDDVPAADRPTTLYIVGVVPDSATRLSVVIAVYDLATRTQIAVCTRNLSGGVANLGRSANQAIGRIIEDLGYQGFNPDAHRMNLRVLAPVAAASSRSKPPTGAPSRRGPQMSCDGTTATSAETDTQPTEAANPTL